MPRRKSHLAPVPEGPGRVVLYRRVSAKMGRGGEDFHSPEVQLAAMRRVTVGMHEVGVVDDIDRTGRHFSREGIEEIRRMALARQIDALAVYDVSRLGRNVKESLTFLDWLANQGVQILSASEQVDTSTPAGRLMLTNMLAIAEYRSDEIGRGWSGTIARRAERGQHHGRPLGYVKRDKQLVPHGVLGPAVSEVFRRYAAGDPIGEITAYLSAVRGRAMHTPNVKKLLRNPVYLGKVIAGDEVLPGQHEPLVDEVTWRRVQDRLAADTSTPPRHLAPTWSLVGLVECPNGHKLQRQGDRLVCGMGRGDVKGGVCEGVGRPLLAKVEAEVLRQVSVYAGRLRTDLDARAARLARVEGSRTDRAVLERQVADARAGMVRLAKNHALNPLPDEVYREALAELRQAERAAASELSRLGPTEPAVDPLEVAGAVDALLVLWPDLLPSERGQALRALLTGVVVRPAARWREPEEDRVRIVPR